MRDAEVEQARFLASFAYVLARVAHADLEIGAEEVAEMEQIVRDIAHLSPAEAALVVQIAKSQAQHLGGTENYVVTREFRNVASAEQRGQLLQCIYAVAAADGTISAIESNEIMRIAEELGFTRPEANALQIVTSRTNSSSRDGWPSSLACDSVCSNSSSA